MNTTIPTVDSTQSVSNNHDSEESILQAFDTSMHTSHTAPEPVGDTPISNTTMSKSKSQTPLFAIVALIAILAGVGTGYGGFRLQTKATTGTGPIGSSDIQQVAQEGSINVGDVFGVDDENTFKDSTEGYLELGGLNGEGSHKLLRPGGSTQTVYLTSSITDLDKFDGMEVRIWGETFKGQKAGWLMDVGRVEVLKTKGEIPEGN